MKKLYLVIYLLLGFNIAFAQQDTIRALNKNLPDFTNWTDEQLNNWEDSVKRALYPEPIIGSTDVEELKKLSQKNKAIGKSSNNTLNFENNHVPNSFSVDKTKDVGEIPIHSSVTPSGSLTYTVPIEMLPGKQGFQPQISLVYNSMAGNGVMGTGWSIGGLSSISRTNRSTYYDDKSQGVDMSKNDAFILDGMRLIKISETATQINYETEQGLIKAKAIVDGDVIRYFEVNFPNGNIGTFGRKNNNAYELVFPLTSFKDMRGNEISYNYTFRSTSYGSYNHPVINSITYNGVTVEFVYTTIQRPDPVITYSAGVKITENHLLEKIICKSGSTQVRVYKMTYITQNNVSLLENIGCSAGEKSLNPIRLLYGEGHTYYNFTKQETQLTEWYNFTQPGQLKISKGKFDYGSENDGLISLPNKNPYWRHFKNKTWFDKQENRYDNLYEGTEKIFLYAGINSDWALPMPNLITEAGFIDILCVNTDGKYEEEVVKVNNTVSGDYDRVQFKVYAGNLYSGLAYQYTRTFNFSTVLTDAKGSKSVHPKFYYQGDFNGDGKMEILAVSCHNPFGWSPVSKCYLFNLETGTKLYEGHAFEYNVEFVGNRQTDPEVAAQNTDRLYVFDYDSDGKTDICLINDYGAYIYTFDVSGSYYSIRQASFYQDLKKADLDGRILMMGEFNGDGKPDFLLSPKDGLSDWWIYYAKGNGQFDKMSTTITTKYDFLTFHLQDLNDDGLTDVIQSGSTSCVTYLLENGNFSSRNYIYYDYSDPIIVPTDINSRQYFNQLVALKDGKITRFSFSPSETRGKLLTGMITGLGVVNKNYYQKINNSDFFNRGYDAVFPFVNFNGPLFALVGTEQYVNSQKIQFNTYSYDNAVMHLQGRGFCGFGKVSAYDNIRGESSTQEFDPYNFGILKSEESNTAKNTNTWSVNVQWNKIAKINLTQRISLNKLTNQTVTSDYTYDSYGNTTGETVNYGAGITTATSQTYFNSTQTPYLIGQPLVKTVTRTRNGSAWTEKEETEYRTDRLPISRITYIGTDGYLKTGETQWTYDNDGNITSEKSVPYNVTEYVGNSYEYDTRGRVTKTVNALGQETDFSNFNEYGNPRTITDHKERTTSYTYNVWGQLDSIAYPDNTIETVSLEWDSQWANRVYKVTKTATGKPATVTCYDAIGRETRTGNQRFDGQWLYTDNVYDPRGRLQKVSLSFKYSPEYWNEYYYDDYNRPTQLTEASGKTTTWSYNGLSVTETKNGIATTKTTDASGALVSVTDPGGTITYTLRADGQPSSITAPGGVVTTFGYDAFGRQTSIADPSAGTQTFFESFTNLGEQTRTVTDANGETVTTISDKYGRVTNVNRPEFSTSYKYKEENKALLEYELSTNGTKTDFTYDTYDRLKTVKETVPDGKWLKKTFNYGSGNITSVEYESQSGSIGTENFMYDYGHNTEIKLNNTTSIWKLTEENALGQPTKAVTGAMQRTYGYTPFGMPTGRTAGTIQNFTYNFDVSKGNLSNRKDNTRNITETFGYDHLNRLSSIGSQQITYADNGNITSLPGVGTLAYGNTAKPYQVTMLTPTGTAVPIREQSVTYTSYQRPNSITENGITATFAYNASGERVKMNVIQGANALLTRYYIGKQYELDAQTNTERLYLGGDVYSAPAVYVKEANVWKIYYICRDYLGSITHIANSDGSLKQELSYSAWGRLRDPATYTEYAPGAEPALFLGRGYTGHEHLAWFGLVNMNARLYDPLLGRFLSPDPYVQMPDFTQNFNRYSYCLNNPLVYVDEDGEFIFTLICTFVPGMQVFLPIAVAADISWMTEYGSQVINNYATNNFYKANGREEMNWKQIWFGKIDWFDVGFAAVGGGFSAAFPVSAPFIRYGSPFITNAIDLYGDGKNNRFLWKNIDAGEYMLNTGLEIGSNLLTDIWSKGLRGQDNINPKKPKPNFDWSKVGEKNVPIKDIDWGSYLKQDLSNNVSSFISTNISYSLKREELKKDFQNNELPSTPTYPIYNQYRKINLNKINSNTKREVNNNNEYINYLRNALKIR